MTTTVTLKGRTSTLREARRRAEKLIVPLQALSGRLRYLLPIPRRFTGAYSSYAEALAAASTGPLAGYDHDEIAPVAFEQMCKIEAWDYPVLFWMRDLVRETGSLVDAGGHMGTKYRAFRSHLPLGPDFRWVVYDLPSIIRAGQRLAEKDKLTRLSFVDRMADAGPAPLFLGSGLMQYLDIPLGKLIGDMPQAPKHLLLNKVALRKGPTVVTLEQIGPAKVPYQIRNEAEFMHHVTGLGYELVDRWAIPSLSSRIDTHPELGASESAGFYFRKI
jgi:putative methyltransferase (TIGR04325 family)